jgi:tetratricopeptide (TPR) repeat protein
MQATPPAASADTALIDAKLDEAFDAFEQGRVDQAQQAFLAVLALSPQEFDALNMLGVIAMQKRDLPRAIDLLQKAVAADPEAGMAYANLGIALLDSAQTEQALATFDKATALEPSLESWFGRGMAQQALKRWEEAIASFKQALALQPAYVEAHFNSGTAYLELKRFEEAAASYDQTLALQPGYVSALINRGHARVALGQADKALADYEEACKLEPRRHAAWVGRGTALGALGRPQDALMCYDKALAIMPQQPSTLIDRGTLLQKLKRLPEAIASYRQVLAKVPDHAIALANLSGALRDMEQHQEALACAQRAIAIDPQLAGAHTNLGNALLDLARPDEAARAFDHALKLAPEELEVQWALSWSLLLDGHWERGLPLMEVRWQRSTFTSQRRAFKQPLWLGDADLRGRTILLHAEQGLGDTLQFCRYVPLVTALGARVLLEVQPTLKGLMASLAGDAVQVIGEGEGPLPDFDFHCPLMSLPLAFKTTPSSVPAQASYLKAPARAVQAVRERLGPADLPRIGLVWSGNVHHRHNRQRSVPLETLLASLPKAAQYYVLQKDLMDSDAQALNKYPELIRLPELLEGFDSTAALVEQMDLVITIDTSIGHLAGALGRPTWLLLSRLPDWRWLMNRADTPWYPSFHLLRQAAWGQWDAPLKELGETLSGWLSSKGRAH